MDQNRKQDLKGIDLAASGSPRREALDDLRGLIHPDHSAVRRHDVW